MSEAKYTEEEAREYGEEIARQFIQQKSNIHTFFTKIIENDSTTKTANLTEEELGLPPLPVRSLKELELFCRDIYSDKSWADYFKEMAEIQTSTSLSKDAILLKLSVTQKKELADVTPKTKKANKGWFKKGNRREQ